LVLVWSYFFVCCFSTFPIKWNLVFLVLLSIINIFWSFLFKNKLIDIIFIFYLLIENNAMLVKLDLLKIVRLNIFYDYYLGLNLGYLLWMWVSGVQLSLYLHNKKMQCDFTKFIKEINLVNHFPISTHFQALRLIKFKLY
jgi:hypothetical protein